MGDVKRGTIRHLGYEALCGRCPDGEVLYWCRSDADAVAEAQSRGWRTSGGRWICPNCLQTLHRENDPEWREYQRLKEKFGE